MQRTHSGRPALVRLARAAAVTLLLGGALAAAQAGASAASSPSSAVTVRIEGPKKTLVAATSVVLSGGTIVKDGMAADSCSGLSAAGALELAARGDWSGTWSVSFSAYFLTAINGVAFPSTGAEYWAFWVNDAPASQGICGYDPKLGDSLLFFPDCFGKTCPKNAGVLGAKAATVAVVGRPFAVAVTAYDDAKGTPSKAVGATVSGGGAKAKTAANGVAKLLFTHAGRFTLKVHAPHAIRTETSVCVETSTAKTCG